MEERNLLSIAYKHITGTLRTSWRTVEGIEKVETGNGRATLREQALIRRQREKIELELADACKDLLDLLDRHLVPAAEAGEERVFYLKMHVFPRLLPTLFFPIFLTGWLGYCCIQAGRLLSVPCGICAARGARAGGEAGAGGLQGFVQARV